MGQVKLIQNKKLTCLYSSLCSDFEYMKGHSGLSTPLPEIMHSVAQKDFKVMKAPAFAKLLALADLGGIADLLSGEGMTFDILEINLKKNNIYGNKNCKYQVYRPYVERITTHIEKLFKA